MSNIRVQFDESKGLQNGPNTQQQKEMIQKRKNLVTGLPPHIILEPILLDQMVTFVWNTLRPKLPEQYQRMYHDQNAIRSRLKDVLFDQKLPQVFYLTVPIIATLTNGPPDCLTAHAANYPKQSILTHCCHHISLAKNFKWKGRDDFVALLLAAGANPNLMHEKFPTKPLIHSASTFGSLETLKLLVSHGVKVDARVPSTGQSCLRDMLTYPRPEMVELVLKHFTDEDIANEVYIVNNEKNQVQKKSSPVDQLLNMWFANTKPAMWNLFGIPTAENTVRCSIELMRRGARITHASFGVACLSKLVSNFDTPDDALEKERHAALFVAKAFWGYGYLRASANRFRQLRRNHRDVQVNVAYVEQARKMRRNQSFFTVEICFALDVLRSTRKKILHVRRVTNRFAVSFVQTINGLMRRILLLVYLAQKI